MGRNAVEQVTCRGHRNVIANFWREFYHSEMCCPADGPLLGMPFSRVLYRSLNVVANKHTCMNAVVGNG